MHIATRGAARKFMVGLNFGEHLLIWGIRRIIAARGPDGLLLDECHQAFASDGATAMALLCDFLARLGLAARRTHEVAPPLSLVLTRDERRILTVLSAAQRGIEDQTLLDAHLCWLAAPAHRPALVQAARQLANMLSCYGYVIHPEQPGEQTDDRPDDVSLHSIRLVAGSHAPSSSPHTAAKTNRHRAVT